VTFAAGLACEGLKPFCAIYSSFLQRGYDQVHFQGSLKVQPPLASALKKQGLASFEWPTRPPSRSDGRMHRARLFCGPNVLPFLFLRSALQVVHDVALQKLPVKFAMDRAGLVGADGASPLRVLRRHLHGLSP